MFGKGLILFGLAIMLSLVAGLFILVFGVEPLTHSEFYTSLLQKHNIPFADDGGFDPLSSIRSYFSLAKFAFYILLIIAAASLLLTFYFKRELLRDGMRRLGLSLAFPGLTVMIAVLLAKRFSLSIDLPPVPGIENFFSEFLSILLRRVMIGAVIVLGVGVLLLTISLYLKRETGNDKTSVDKVADNKPKKTAAAKETEEED